MYVRNKNQNCESELLRCGSKVTNYKNIFLQNRKITFLLIGDYSKSDTSRLQNVHTAESLKINKSLFSLIAWCFANRFILEPGGPISFPIIFGKKFLLLNYPWINQKLPGALMTYKSLYKNTNKNARPHKIFQIKKLLPSKTFKKVPDPRSQRRF